MGKEFGFRNAQATVIAPTGTIGLVMDCDTTGVEPDFALVKFKTLAGGGYFKIINRCVPEALASLGYTEPRSTPSSPMRWAMARWKASPGGSIWMPCAARALATSRSAQIEAALESAFDIRFVFNKWTLGEKFCREVLKLDAATMDAPEFDMLKALGFSRADIDAANLLCLRRHDAGRRALPEGPSICRCSIAPIRAGASASGRCRWKSISA